MNELKEYLRTNKIKNSTLATEMGVTHVTMCNAIAEKYGNAETETETEIEAEFEADTETWD